WRKRLALARELVRRPDLLLLDEPTNHLDVPGIVWLERLLRDASFSYVVATHDRAFLRAVADEVIEVSRAYPDGYFRAAGSYDEFADRREEFLEDQARRQLAAAKFPNSLGGRPLFANLDLTLAPGAKLGLVGPNGSGKSTLLRVLAGEIAPDAGTLHRADELRAVMFEQGRGALDPSVPLRK